MKLLHTLLTITILFGSNALRAMNDEAEKEKALKKEYESRVASAKKLQQWAKEAKELKYRSSLAVEQTKDDDEEDEALMQYFNGKRDDLENILNKADAKERESRK